MKTTYYFTLITLSLLIAGCGKTGSHATADNDRERLNLKGNVTSVHETVYATQPGGNDLLLYEGDTWLFNDAGMLTHTSTVAFNGWEMLIESTAEAVYTYNDEGKLVEKTQKHRFGDTEPDLHTTSYSYNNNGQLVTEGDLRLIYDDKGRCTEKLSLADNTPQQRIKYKGNNVETYYLDRDTNDKEYVQLMRVNSYNDKQQLVETSLSTSPKSKPLHKYTYSYNDKGDCAEEYIIENELDLWEGHHFYEYTYDSNGNWIERIKYVLPAENYRADGDTGEKRAVQKVKRTITYGA